MSRRRHNNRYRPETDVLEGRALLASGVTVNVVSGILMIEGTEQADSVQVMYRVMPSNPRWPAPPSAMGIVTIDGFQKVRVGRFSGIAIHARGGDDVIRINQIGSRGVPIGIDAGAGNDLVIGGPGGDFIFGNDGDDTIWGGGGLDTLIGGEGRDTIDGVLEPLPIPTAPAPAPAPAPVNPPPPVVPPKPPAVPPASTPKPGVDLAAFARDVVTYTNAERQKAGQSTLRVSQPLTRMAQLHAEAMAQADRMEHTLPGAAYPTLRDRANYVGYQFSRLGENIAFNFKDASTLTFSWMTSPGHRDNLLHADFTEIGVGIAANSRGELFIAQVLGRPKS